MHKLAFITNTTYEEINILVFVVIQPVLLLFFFILWIRANSNKRMLLRVLRKLNSISSI